MPLVGARGYSLHIRLSYTRADVVVWILYRFPFFLSTTVAIAFRARASTASVRLKKIFFSCTRSLCPPVVGRKKKKIIKRKHIEVWSTSSWTEERRFCPDWGSPSQVSVCRLGRQFFSFSFWTFCLYFFSRRVSSRWLQICLWSRWTSTLRCWSLSTIATT